MHSTIAQVLIVDGMKHSKAIDVCFQLPRKSTQKFVLNQTCDFEMQCLAQNLSLQSVEQKLHVQEELGCVAIDFFV